MSELSRRNVLGATVAAGTLAAASTAGPSFAEVRQPPWGPGPAPLLGAELPSFRYPLGESPSNPMTEDGRRRRLSPSFRSPIKSPAC
jgi:hypothetical protein